MIRLAGAADADDVARLLLAFREWMGAPPDDEVRARFSASVRELIGRPDTEFLLGGEGPDAVAQVRYRPSVWTGTDDCWLEDLFVDAPARGRGLGREMVEAVLGRARDRGCARVELDTFASNEPARALYASLGFTDKGESGSILLQRRL